MYFHSKEVSGLGDEGGELQHVANRVMESFIHSRHRANMMQSRWAYRQKPGEIMVLYCIHSHAKQELPGIMVSEISGKLNVTSPTITQHINSLEAQGLVERRADPDDRRVVRVQLTDQGHSLILRINEYRLRMFVELVEFLGKEESLRFAETLRKASDFLWKYQEARHFAEDGDDGT